MTSYNVTSGNGTQERMGMPRAMAERVAQEIADETGEAVEVWSADRSEEWTVEPSTTEIARYADEHTADCGGDRARALREMSDEPSEVAVACGTTAERVREWISQQTRALTTVAR